MFEIIFLMASNMDSNNIPTIKLQASKKIFDPRIIDNDSGTQQLWNSESIELAVKGIKDGYKLKESPYNRTIAKYTVRKANLAYLYTDDELECMRRCAGNKIFFSDNFMQLKDAQKGWVNIKTRDYQRKILHNYTMYRWNILMIPRQSGKTTTTIIEIVHFCTFNFDKDVVVIAQSQKVVDEIFMKIMTAFESLPFFMQPGFVSCSKSGFVLDNGCRLTVGVASESVVQGFSLDLLFIDEFAYIPNSKVNAFWENIYPSLTNNPESRCIIASTPNGRNLFHSLWTKAVNKLNNFVPFRIYWYDVPGRTEQFKKETIENVGLAGWLMGFECSFDVGLKSIFPTKFQQHLRKLQLENENTWSLDNSFLGLYGVKTIKGIDNISFKKEWFLFSIDISEGLEQDYSVLKIKRLSWNVQLKRIEYNTIGVYHENDVSIEDFAVTLLDILKFFTLSNVRVVVENNTYGSEFFLNIDNLIMNYSEKYRWFNDSVFAKFVRKSKNGYERGIRWNKYNKNSAVKSFSNLCLKNMLNETYPLSIEEYLNFGKVGSTDSYAASYGHDDLCMADVTAAYFIKSKDLFVEQWLKQAELSLRIANNDEPEEIIKAREEAKRKREAIYQYNGFSVRQHEDYVNKNNNKALTVLI